MAWTEGGTFKVLFGNGWDLGLLRRATKKPGEDEGEWDREDSPFLGILKSFVVVKSEMGWAVVLVAILVIKDQEQVLQLVYGSVVLGSGPVACWPPQATTEVKSGHPARQQPPKCISGSATEGLQLGIGGGREQGGRARGVVGEQDATDGAQEGGEVSRREERLDVMGEKPAKEVSTGICD
ncbi:hypothetical protein G7Z17_g13635 [Cylindrodendrum hubeiense]|uniref:Uncharacterized protein n=1 Tax=Cylindrodendrum hubeiense TaxID=595255 RepID=A0A9P5H0M8_9HYPO|nr:hypothetical protein G7Z17_g13635 [Cylindrodendrum hubeiense]